MNAFTRKPDVSAFVKKANKDHRSAAGGLASATLAQGQCLIGFGLPQRVHDLRKKAADEARDSHR